MYELSTVTPRVEKLRQIYRDAPVTLDAERTRTVTEYYRSHRHELPIMRRANVLYNILSNMTVRVEPNELIVGNAGKYYRGCCIWPEYRGLKWLEREIKDGSFDTKTAADGYMTLDQEDRDYLVSVADFWEDHRIGAKLDANLPAELETLTNAEVLPQRYKHNGHAPVGHYNVNYRKAAEKGFGAIKQEAQEKVDALTGNIWGKDSEKYFFYKAIVISCDAVIVFAKRYAAECRAQAENMTDEKRRRELQSMAQSLDWIMENPARTFHEAVQAVFLYHMILDIEGSYLGLTLGRFDQHTGDYLKADLEAGRITLPEAQEIVDCFFLKMGELCMSGDTFFQRFIGAYTSNQRLTLSGRKPDGSDATNEVTYLCLQASARLKLHDPTLSLCMHKDSPAGLYEAGIETAKIVGGIPTLENTDLIIDILYKRGMALEDARNFCVVGCVEITGSGCEFANPSAAFSNTFLNINNILLQAVNNGVSLSSGKSGGLQAGRLTDFKTFDDFKEAFTKQLHYFMDWQFTLNNIMEYVGYPEMPIPVASATMDGCMENGQDMMMGGAKYNATGGAILGIGTLIDSLSAIKHLVYDKKLCTAQELINALEANWEGFESLRQRAISEVPHYGNGDPYTDELGTWAIDLFTDRYNSYIGPRGIHRAGSYSAGAHMLQGYQTFATPNGRKAGEPVSDGASPSQGCDNCGPIGVAQSIVALHPEKFGNGMQFCMKFHPTSLRGEDGTEKLKNFVETFFDLGGMQIQYNMVGSDTLRKAKANPEEYRDLVVRVAGFSAYFVELYEGLQDDMIRRTEIDF